MSNLSDYPPGMTQATHDAAHRDYPCGTEARAQELAAESWENQDADARDWLMENMDQDECFDAVSAAVRCEAMPMHEDCRLTYTRALDRLRAIYVAENSERYMDAAANEMDEEETC